MNRRALIAGAIILGVLAAGFVAVYFLLGDRNGGPSNNSSPSPSPADVRTQVEQRYLRYWDVWKEANLELDSSILDEVMAEDALEKARRVIEQAKQNNEPVLIRVQHNYTISILTDFVSIDDSVLDRSVRVDPQTMKPVGPERNEVVRNTYTLKKVGGQWKVTFVTG